MENLIQELIKQNEHALLDFKTQFYEITDEGSKISFIKDILAFANSTVNDKGYIICGVNETNTGEKNIVGISETLRIDDANWINLLNSYSSHPVLIKFHRIKLGLYNKYVAVIEVDSNQNRPVICKKEAGNKLKEGLIYFRNGSNNDFAKDYATFERMIKKEVSSKDKVAISRSSKLPQAPYINFRGRTDELTKINKELINHHKNYLLALNGDGGVGKTSIAYKVASDLKDQIDNGSEVFDDVIWISAKDQRLLDDERMLLHRDFKTVEDLFERILLVFENSEDIISLSAEGRRIKVNEALEGTKFFFVLDNLEVFSHDEIIKLHSFINEVPLGHKFLLTSRHDLRVQGVIQIEPLNKTVTRQYIEDILYMYEINSSQIAAQLFECFEDFFQLTEGNPLYIRFFIAQMKKGRELSDILRNRNLEGEKALKAYCFDETLSMLTEDEQKIMFSLAINGNKQMTFHELRFITSLERDSLFSLLENLNAVSMVDQQFKSNQKYYSINALLGSYLIEEQRVPSAESLKLKQKANKIIIYSSKIPEKYEINFGLKSLLNAGEIMSYNMIIDLFEKRDPQRKEIEEILSDAKKLHPGNYLSVFYTNYFDLLRRRDNGYKLISGINSDFASIEQFIQYEEEHIFMQVYKCLLYMKLRSYDDVLISLESVQQIETEHRSLLAVLEASAKSKKAGDEYKSERFKNHDNLRDDSSELFDSQISDFIKKPYFDFLKRNILQEYKSNHRHLKSDRAPIITTVNVTNNDTTLLSDFRF